MAIADITLLSGFEPKTEDLDLVSGSIGFKQNSYSLHVHRYSIERLYFTCYIHRAATLF